MTNNKNQIIKIKVIPWYDKDKIKVIHRDPIKLLEHQKSFGFLHM